MNAPVKCEGGWGWIGVGVSLRQKKIALYTLQGKEKSELIKMVHAPLRKEASTEDLKPFEISGVYILDSNGVVISQNEVPSLTESDAEIFTPMFTAVKIFIKDSSHPFMGLKNVQYGGYKILIEEGKEFFLVVIGKGDYINPIREDMKRTVEGLNERYAEDITNQEGNSEVLLKIRRELDVFTKSFRSKCATMNEE
jgi:hypothetical protein